ncbi:hypothetical protein ACN28G_02685 [Micromonospora sp. WMMA1923]|uniref:hypothetical protein n=1 Tax=Micromonospora sp. WMMA1923 TaxID=3404125 RepID=UPI003B936FD3
MTVLLLVAGVLSAVHLVGVLTTSPLLPSAEVLAWVALAGVALVAGASASWPVRLALLAVPLGLAVPAAVAYLRHFVAEWNGEAGGYGFVGYTPLGPLQPAWAERWWFLVPGVVGCVAVAVLVRALSGAHDGSPNRVDRILAAVLAGGFVAGCYYDLTYRWSAWENWTVGGFLGTALPPVLLAGVLLGLGLTILVRVGARTLAVGTALLALTLLGGAWQVGRRGRSGGGDGPEEVFLMPEHGSLLSLMPEFTSLAVPPAVLSFAQLVAAAALLVGCRRVVLARKRAHGGVRPGS